VTHSWSHISL